MSPHLIIILMLSSCALLIMLLFALRKRSKKTAVQVSNTSPETTLPDLSQINLSGLETHMPKAEPHATSSELMELINRHQFFQGKNLEQFTTFAQENNWQKIEQLIYEKFTAQKKENAQQLAQEVGKKLLSLQHSKEL